VGEIVSDGKIALDRVRQERPQAIFADLTIKGMGGEALCSALKKDAEMRSIPFIILSGDRDIEEKARGCGADDHLGKPFEFQELIELVRKHAHPNQ
jgi:CheY-like chemotaxis protein